MPTLKILLADDSGATAVEYGLIAAAIAMAVIAGASAIGSDLSRIFNSVSTGVKAGS